jgi:hypothetical protein
VGVLTIRELRRLVISLSAGEFHRQLGPFVLIQRPKEGQTPTGTLLMGVPMNAQQTMMARAEKVERDALSMLFQFEDLTVATLPPFDGAALSVGRQLDCDLVLDDPSVSKRHASLTWDPEKAHCMLEDVGSTNGTFLNAAIRLKRRVALRDGDIVSFGEVAFWYLLSGTLHARLRDGSGLARVGARSG